LTTSENSLREAATEKQTCKALCPNCHANKTEEDRHKCKQRKTKEKGRSTDVLGIRSIFGPQSKREKASNILSILGETKGRKRKNKQKSPFDLGLNLKLNRL